MKTIYISGKITGLSIEEAMENFLKAEKHLIDKCDCYVINPMNKPIEEGKTWGQYMLEDIEKLFECEAIYMLSNWEDSKGAKIEYAIAKNMGKVILYETPKHKRQITEKELKIAAKGIKLKRGVIEQLVNAVRENQSNNK